ncbi:MAG: phage terminase large subunit [Vampirovibrio sp.]
MSKTILNAILRSDFTAFVQKVFLEVSPNAQYLGNWHIDLICHELEAMLAGQNPRLIVNIPPRYMKSIICSIAFPAYILGKNPKATIITVSYNEDLSQKLALDCKRVMESQWYRDIFSHTRLSKNKKAIADFETSRGGGRFSTSVNGTLTGRGADYLIIDDPIKPDDALSDLLRKKTNDWYGSTLYSRLNNKNDGKIMVIMQRLHDEDFTGYLLQSDQTFKHLKIPAIAETEETWSFKHKTVTRQRGEALHPERESVLKLMEAKKQMGEYHFSGQYQQNPAPRDGGIIKKKWLKYYDPNALFKAIAEKEIRIKSIFQSWDTASKIEQYNDYSVCLTVLRDSKGVHYILDAYREKLEFPQLVNQVIQRYKSAETTYGRQIDVLIEDKNSGIQLIQTLKTQHFIKAKAVKPEQDKRTRLMAVSHLIENGSCLFPNNDPHWLLEFESELLRFPNGKHDDQCDALSQVLVQPNTYSVFDAYRD